MYTRKEMKAIAWELMVANGNPRAASKMLMKRYKMRIDVRQLREFSNSENGKRLIAQQKKAERKMFQTLQDMLQMSSEPKPSNQTTEEQREIDQLAKQLQDMFHISSPTNPAADIGPTA